MTRFFEGGQKAILDGLVEDEFPEEDELVQLSSWNDLTMLLEVETGATEDDSG